MSRSICFGWVIAGLGLAALGCARTVVVDEDWLGPESTMRRWADPSAWRPRLLTHPWGEGLEALPAVDDASEPLLRSLGRVSRFTLEVIEPGARVLVLDGSAPAHPNGSPQTVEVWLNGVRVTRRTVEEEQATRVTVAQKLLNAGRNEVELRMAYAVNDDGTLSDSASDGWSMLWRRIGFEPGKVKRLGAKGRGPAVQPAATVWWRWLPTDTDVEWTLRGQPIGNRAVVDLWIDRGTGRWEALQTEAVEPEEPFDLATTVTGKPGSIARLGVVVRRGRVTWASIKTKRRVSATSPRPIVLITVGQEGETGTTRCPGGDKTDPDTTLDATTAPMLSKLISEGVIWSRPSSQATSSTASTHASLLVGDALRGVEVNAQAVSRVGEDGDVMPRATGDYMAIQALAHGYQTAAFVSSRVLSSAYAFHQGFSVFGERFGTADHRPPDALHERVLPWIAAHPQGEGKPATLLWLHYALAPTDGSIAGSLDRVLAVLWPALESAGWLDHGVAMIVPACGTGLGLGPGGPTAVLWGDGIEARTLDAALDHRDVAPTLWARVGLPIAEGWRGVDRLASVGR